MVVLFHAVPGLLEGGFIGVDVFFVISGFLITGLLVREMQRTGRVDLANFYVRRFRRLLPAAALAIGVTFLLSAWLIAPLDLPRVAGDGVAAAFSLANVRFAMASGDYFNAIATPSPFLHYWSLSVEEQFYLVWPALLIVAFAIARGLRGVLLAVAVVALLSLLATIVVTDTAVNWAFYSLPTRAWQLALGGLLAIGVVAGWRTAGRSRGLALVGWLGLGAVLIAGLAFDAGSSYPGLWALVPTLGAAAIIAAGDGRFGPGLLLRTAPMRFFGRISYALYLWHWPLLVLPAVAVAGELTLGARAALVLAAILVATASTLFVEEPIRRGPAPGSRRRQLVVAGSLGFALLFSVGVGLGAVNRVTDAAMAATRGDIAAVDGVSDRRARREASSLARDRLEAGRARDTAGEVAAALAAPGQQGPDPEAEMAQARIPRQTQPPPSEPPAARSEGRSPRATPLTTPKPTPRPEVKATPRPKTPTPPVIALPPDVRPSLWEAREDEELLRRNGCLEAESATEPRRCVFGDASSKFTVALVGDSHASHWFPALNRVANANGWRLVTFVKVSCPFADYPVRNLQLKRTYRECEGFNENTVAALQSLKPDLVVTSLFRFQYPIRSSDESVTAQGAGIARMLDRVPGRKAIIADVPFASNDVPACLSKNLKDVRPCAVLSYRRTSGGSPARERIAAELSDATIVNLGRAICGGPGNCPVVKDGLIVYRDEHHLTATFSRSLAPALERALLRALRSRS